MLITNWCNVETRKRTSQRLRSIIKQYLPNYVTEIFDERVYLTQKEVTKATHRNALTASSLSFKLGIYSKTTTVPIGTTVISF